MSQGHESEKLDELSRSILEAITRSPRVQRILLSLDSEDLLRDDSYIIVSLRPAGNEAGGALPRVQVESRHEPTVSPASYEERGSEANATSLAEPSPLVEPALSPEDPVFDEVMEDEVWLRQIGLRFDVEAPWEQIGEMLLPRQCPLLGQVRSAFARIGHWLLRVFRIFMFG